MPPTALLLINGLDGLGKTTASCAFSAALLHTTVIVSGSASFNASPTLLLASRQWCTGTAKA